MCCCLTDLEVGWVADQYIVPEDDESKQNIMIRVGTRIQNPLHLRLTATETPGLDAPHQATAGQDFTEETVVVAVPGNTFQEYSVSIADVIIDDKRVESLFQNFTLRVEIVEEGIYFDSDNTTERTAEISIEDDDSECVIIS